MTPNEISLIEFILYACALVGTISGVFWRVITGIKIQVAKLEGVVAGYNDNQEEVRKNHHEMSTRIKHIDMQLTELIGFLKGSGHINGSSPTKPLRHTR